MSLQLRNIRFRQVYLKSVNKLPTFSNDKSDFWTSYFFCLKLCLKVGSAAYTQVQLIHKSLRKLCAWRDLKDSHGPLPKEMIMSRVLKSGLCQRLAILLFSLFEIPA